MIKLDRFLLPKRWERRLDILTEGQIMVLGFVWKLSKMYKEEYLEVYKSDVQTMVNSIDSSGVIHNIFIDTKMMVEVANIGEWKIAIKPINYGHEEMTYVIKDLRNVVMWSYVMSHEDFTEYEMPIERQRRYTPPYTYQGQLKRYLISSYPTFRFDEEIKRRKDL